MTAGDDPTRVEFDEARRAEAIARLQEIFADRFDEALSEFRANQLLDWFLAELAPAVYNQAIDNARGYVFARLEDLAVDLRKIGG